MDIITLGLSVTSVAVIPAGTAVFRRTHSNEKRLTILETENKNLEATVTRIEAKVDRLIERFL